MKSGIYTITNIVNGKIYVGSTSVAINKRKNSHFSNLRLNKHNNRYLQYSFNKYKAEAFIFEVLEFCEPEFVISLENYWINLLDSRNPERGYNINNPVSLSRGLKRSEESKEKMMISQLKFRGITSEEDIKEHIKKKNKPKETFQQKSERCKGNKNPFFGKTHTKEARDKINAAKSWIKNYKPVGKYDLEWNLIKEYESIKEAKLDINTSSSGDICKALKSVNRTCKGFKWKYL